MTNGAVFTTFIGGSLYGSAVHMNMSNAGTSNSCTTPFRFFVTVYWSVFQKIYCVVVNMKARIESETRKVRVMKKDVAVVKLRRESERL
ncbi:cellulose synthase-like protein G3 [Pyrus ussuriensis x Pyrus communis]|uniref:Cellulose synthase-like protein G3 n=1 Tax=Pyrus ussuriensis x Pyrus communis TaxID=2448454 RepID=A0A5N5G5Q7_9ROSA|nr:cellulose synthase-like protein G3 [Pyrus ussuriensis x Pyrus communis]